MMSRRASQDSPGERAQHPHRGSLNREPEPPLTTTLVANPSLRQRAQAKNRSSPNGQGGAAKRPNARPARSSADARCRVWCKAVAHRPAGPAPGGRLRSHGYVQVEDPEYMLTIADRGADALAASGTIGRELADALKGEARRRVTAHAFFGHVAYANLTARRPG